MIVAGTGHRPNKLDNDYTYTSVLSNRIMGLCTKIIELYKPTKIISGMAQGFDTMWALTALKCHIPLVCALPCKNQDIRWPDKSKNLYRKMLTFASEVVYVSEDYSWDCMQIRNEWMVDRCDLLLGLHDGSPGGTNNCIKYAIAVKRKHIIFNPTQLMYEQSVNYLRV